MKNLLWIKALMQKGHLSHLGLPACLVWLVVTGAHAQANCTSAPLGLVGWWPAEGNAIDIVNGNNGTLQPGAGFAPGLAGRAFAFNGATNSFVEVPDAPSLHATVAVTIEFWVKRTSLDFSSHTADYVLEKGGDWTGNVVNYGAALHTAAYNYCLHFTFAGGWRGGGSVPDLNWHHCAIVARNGDANPTFYVDGVQQIVAFGEGAPTITLYDSNRPLHIGAMLDPVTGWNYYGREVVDELSIYNRALSPGEIQSIYAAGSAGKCPPNSWTNPVSARWDQSANWSFATLPASDQTVNIANAGYKAVNIDGATLANFPASVTVNNLFVAAPTNALSTLLLNYAGLNTPLKVLDNCIIGPNGTIANYSSSFEVDGNAGGELLVDRGNFTQVGGQTVVNAPVFVRNGSLNATNANLTLGQLTVGSGTGSQDPYSPDAVFTQDGGSIAAQSVDIEQGGRYQLISGVLYGINGTTVTGCPFWQYGGTNYGNITTLNYYYWLRAGMVQGNVLTAANEAGFVQDDGLLDMQFINVTGTTNHPALGGPWFGGGIVHCGTLNIGGNGKVELRGSDFFVTNNFDLHGMEFIVGDQGPVIEHADVSLRAGTLHLPSMTLGPYATFSVIGGSNEISGGLSVTGGSYWVAAGSLETAYTGVGAAGTFTHSGGNHLIHGGLSITGAYAQSGGNVVCEGLYLRGVLTMTRTYMVYPPPPVGTFTNTGLLNLGGTISTELPEVEAGQVQLATNATIAFSNGFPAVLRFGNSSAVGWTAGALLVITNWSNSDHVFAGNDASGLTASQLRQIVFSNPGGFAPGAYPAQLLSTGELVPNAARPTLQSARIGSALVFSWTGNHRLLSATNLAGPYTPVSGASSPWTNHFTKPREFFMLQGL